MSDAPVRFCPGCGEAAPYFCWKCGGYFCYQHKDRTAHPFLGHGWPRTCEDAGKEPSPSRAALPKPSCSPRVAQAKSEKERRSQPAESKPGLSPLDEFFASREQLVSSSSSSSNPLDEFFASREQLVSSSSSSSNPPPAASSAAREDDEYQISAERKRVLRERRREEEIYHHPLSTVVHPLSRVEEVSRASEEERRKSKSRSPRSNRTK